MNIDRLTIWLVAAGDGEHHYAFQCLAHGLVLMGPGKLGAWPDCERPLLDTGWTPNKMAILRTFCETMQGGDIVVLHVGSRVYGVGELKGPYLWDPKFSIVQGWDLQHTRPVCWRWKGYEKPRAFQATTFGRGATVRRLTSPAVLDWLEALEPNVD